MALNPVGPSGPPCVMGHAHDHRHDHGLGSSQAGAAFRWSIALNSGLTVLQLLIGFGLVKGVESGWVELHWQRLLHDVGIPFVPDPENPAPQGQQT